MPKLPKSVARSRAQEGAKKKPAREPKGNGKAASKNDDTIEFDHRQVGRPAAAASTGNTPPPPLELKKSGRGLLSALSPVTGEPRGAPGPGAAREPIERAFLFTCE